MMFLHPLQGCTLRNLLRLYHNNKISLHYLHRALYIATRTIIGLPFRLTENQLYAKKVAAMSVSAPIFILGHWRSGTTLLHNTLALDPQFCYPTWVNVYASNAYICSKSLIQFIGKIIGPIKRPMDEISVRQEDPSEDEFILANMGYPSPYHGFYFHRQQSHYQHYTFLDEITAEELILWKTHMMTLYKKITFTHANKQILSKNPPHTARIKYLLELFPNAKFIHIYRNPYEVYASTVNAFKKLIAAFTLQKLDKIYLENIIFSNYNKLMNAFFQQKDLISPENFVEIRFEYFKQQPINELKKIYSTLGLSNFDQMQNKFSLYFDQLKNYPNNKFSLDAALTDEIYQHWHFTIDRWKYTPPQTEG